MGNDRVTSSDGTNEADSDWESRPKDTVNTTQTLIISSLAFDAIDAQRKIDLEEVLHLFRKAVRTLDGMNQHTKWVNEHPVVKLYTLKVMDLANVPIHRVVDFVDAMALCKRMAAGDVDAYPPL